MIFYLSMNTPNERSNEQFNCVCLLTWRTENTSFFGLNIQTLHRRELSYLTSIYSRTIFISL